MHLSLAHRLTFEFVRFIDNTLKFARRPMHDSSRRSGGPTIRPKRMAQVALMVSATVLIAISGSSFLSSPPAVEVGEQGKTLIRFHLNVAGVVLEGQLSSGN